MPMITYVNAKSWIKQWFVYLCPLPIVPGSLVLACACSSSDSPSAHTHPHWDPCHILRTFLRCSQKHLVPPPGQLQSPRPMGTFGLWPSQYMYYLANRGWADISSPRLLLRRILRLLDSSYHPSLVDLQLQRS